MRLVLISACCLLLTCAVKDSFYHKNFFEYEKFIETNQLYETWRSIGGLEISRWLRILNCTKFETSDRKITEHRSIMNCYNHILHQLCSNTPDPLALIPTSTICDTQSKELGPYKICMTNPHFKGPCVGISLGVSDDWYFEDALYEKTTCEIHSFPVRHNNMNHDHRAPPASISLRTTFHSEVIQHNISNKGDTRNGIPFNLAMNMSNVNFPLSVYGSRIRCITITYFNFHTMFLFFFIKFAVV